MSVWLWNFTLKLSGKLETVTKDPIRLQNYTKKKTTFFPLITKYLLVIGLSVNPLDTNVAMQHNRA